MIPKVKAVTLKDCVEIINQVPQSSCEPKVHRYKNEKIISIRVCSTAKSSVWF